MVKISVPIIARNIVKLKYPLDKVVESVVGFADEVVLSVDPSSEDDTLDYAYDVQYEINRQRRHEGTRVRIIENVWDLANINKGSEFAIQTNKSIEACEGDWILVLQADEAIHESAHEYLRDLAVTAVDSGTDAYSMIRLYFFGDIATVRRDWTVPIIRFFRKGTRFSDGDAMNTSGSDRVSECDAYIYHYSRIGDPVLISQRIRVLDGFFHPSSILLPEDSLNEYDFSLYNFDCMSVDDDVVGRKKVSDEGVLIRFYGTHPKPFVDYRGTC